MIGACRSSLGFHTMPAFKRVRLRSDESLTYQVFTYFTDLSVSGFVGIPAFTIYDQIADSKHRRKLPDHPYPNGDVQHQTFRNKARVKPYHAYGAGKIIVFQDSPPIISSTEVASMVPFVPDYRWSQLNGDAFTVMSTQFPEEISIANFLWELRELGDLIPKLSDSVAKTLAGAHLNQEFGWKPFLADLATLGNLTSQVTARLEWLRKTWGKKVKLGHYVANCYEHSSDDLHTSFAYNLGWDFSLVSYRSDYRAGGRLFHQMKDLDDTIGVLKGFAGALGLNNPLKAIWQALPFSFVVDWFFHVNKHLARMATLSDQTAGWSVSDMSSSIKTTATIRVVQNNNESDNWGYPPTDIGVIDVELYERRNGLLVDSDVYHPDNLSPSQLTLALALIGANH
jgi:hypothetical protein